LKKGGRRKNHSENEKEKRKYRADGQSSGEIIDRFGAWLVSNERNCEIDNKIVNRGVPNYHIK